MKSVQTIELTTNAIKVKAVGSCNYFVLPEPINIVYIVTSPPKKNPMYH